MAELIDKRTTRKTIEKYFESLAPSHYYKMDLEKASAYLVSEISELPTTTEAEIRNRAIDEFAEKLCDAFSEKYGEVTVNGIKFDVLTLDGATEITWDVAEQLKGECVNEKEKF